MELKETDLLYAVKLAIKLIPLALTLCLHSGLVYYSSSQKSGYTLSFYVFSFVSIIMPLDRQR